MYANLIPNCYFYIYVDDIRIYYYKYFFRVDVSNRQEVLDAAALVKQEVGSVSVLVNNAGIMPCRPLFSQSHETIEKIFNVNVLAHFWVNPMQTLNYILD